MIECLRELVKRWRAAADKQDSQVLARALYAVSDDLCELLNVLEGDSKVTRIPDGLCKRSERPPFAVDWDNLPLAESLKSDAMREAAERIGAPFVNLTLADIDDESFDIDSEF